MGAVAGKAAVMEMFNHSRGKAPLPHGGTFNGNPLSAVAGTAALIWSVEIPAWVSNDVSVAAHSSGVRVPAVVRRHFASKRSPAKRPIVISVFPTSRARSTLSDPPQKTTAAPDQYQQCSSNTKVKPLQSGPYVEHGRIPGCQTVASHIEGDVGTQDRSSID